MIGIIVIGVIGMYIFSAIVGRVLGVSKEMAFAVSLTAFIWLSSRLYYY